MICIERDIRKTKVPGRPGRRLTMIAAHDIGHFDSRADQHATRSILHDTCYGPGRLRPAGSRKKERAENKQSKKCKLAEIHMYFSSSPGGNVWSSGLGWPP